MFFTKFLICRSICLGVIQGRSQTFRTDEASVASAKARASSRVWGMLPRKIFKSTPSEMLFSAFFFVKFFFKIQYRASEKTADFLVLSTFSILTIRACNTGTKLMAIQSLHRSYTPHPRLPAPLLAMAGNSCKNPAASRLSNSVAAAICRTPLWPERKRHITSSQHGCSRERPFTETPLSEKPFDPAKWLF